ncbi:hypothetical protein NQ318_019946, partial [Aromia moschata]
AYEGFREVFPDAVIHFDYFSRSVKRFLNLYRQTGSVNWKQGSGRPTITTEENVEMVRQVITDNPRTSISQLNKQNTRPWSVDNFHLYIETPLHPQTIIVCAAVSSRRIVGPIFFLNEH